MLSLVVHCRTYQTDETPLYEWPVLSESSSDVYLKLVNLQVFWTRQLHIACFLSHKCLIEEVVRVWETCNSCTQISYLSVRQLLWGSCAQCFTFHIGASGFHQILLRGGQPQNFIQNTSGSFTKILPFGWTNAPATFQAIMSTLSWVTCPTSLLTHDPLQSRFRVYFSTPQNMMLMAQKTLVTLWLKTVVYCRNKSNTNSLRYPQSWHIRRLIFCHFHGAPYGGHPGVKRTL